MRINRVQRVVLCCGAFALCATAAHAQLGRGPGREPVREIGASEKLHPQLLRLIAERGPSKAWVFFKDKGISGRDELADSLARAELALDHRALERRRLRREAPGLVDLRDVPVHPSYVDAVMATGAEVVVESSWLNAISAHATRSQLEAIAALPFVDRVEPVRRGELIDPVTPSGPGAIELKKALPPSFYGMSQAQLAQINLPRVHRLGFTGKGVVIGVLDTGFHRGHEAFNHGSRTIDVIAEYDFVNNDPFTGIEPGDPPSQHNHGTWILGTLAAYLPGELVGGAFDASYILCKTEDTTNEYQQEEDFYVAGLQFIEANGGDMATSSLGYIDWYTQASLNGLTATTTIAVNTATANGVYCCTAAGNSYHDSNPSTSSLIAPADALQVLTVGAVDVYGAIASFSSDGPTADQRVKPEVLAMGVSTWTVCSYSDTDCTSQVSGTSLATPVLAGGVACLIGAHPNWTVAYLRRRLFQSGDYFLSNETYDPLFVQGYGIPDMYRAGFDPLPTRLLSPGPPTPEQWSLK